MSTTSATSVAGELVEAFGSFGPAYMKWLHAGVSTTTYARMRLLHALHQRGPQIMSAIGECLAVTPRNVTVLVDGLEREGLVRREPHPEDRRATIVDLTPEGQGVVAEAFAEHTARAVALFEGLKPAEQKTLLTLIRRLTDELVTRSAEEGTEVQLPR